MSGALLWSLIRVSLGLLINSNIKIKKIKKIKKFKKNEIIYLVNILTNLFDFHGLSVVHFSGVAHLRAGGKLSVIVLCTLKNNI